jgi:hypothetical protein
VFYNLPTDPLVRLSGTLSGQQLTPPLALRDSSLLPTPSTPPSCGRCYPRPSSLLDPTVQAPPCPHMNQGAAYIHRMRPQFQRRGGAILFSMFVHAQGRLSCTSDNVPVPRRIALWPSWKACPVSKASADVCITRPRYNTTALPRDSTRASDCCHRRHSGQQLDLP